jgi:parvulin-like peptidyl-prolyl isomerase
MNHWIAIAVSSASPVSSPKVQPAPVPPDFTACIVYHRANDPKPAKGQPAPATTALKAECQQAYASALAPVMNFLVTADWFQGEAAAEGVKVSTATVKAQLSRDEAATVSQGTVASPAQLRGYLAGIGETTQDELYRIGIQVLSDELTNKAIAAAPKPTGAQIAAFYAANRAKFSQPESRDVRVVRVKQLVVARRALAQLKAGVGFSTVVKRFSVDSSTNSRGGLLEGLTQATTSLTKNVAAAVFTAPVHAIRGPIHTTLGYEIFRVEKVTPATQQTLQQASSQISATLVVANQKAATAAFDKEFDAKWLRLTKCKAAFAVATNPPICRNAPAPSP